MLNKEGGFHMEDKVVIYSKYYRGEDGFRAFSVRVPMETLDALEQIAGQSGRSRNEIISILLRFGIEHCEVKEIL